ncbi:MAG: HEAT repeat domain-containing protein [bacterium]
MDLNKIVKNLSDKSPIFGKGRRKKAIEELSKIGTSEVVPYLVLSLSDPDGDIKRLAFSSLCHLSNTSAIDYLCSNYLKDRNEKVWEIITTRGFAPSSSKERILFFIKTGQTAKCIPPSSPDIPVLIEMLENSETKNDATRILSSINDDAMKEELFNSLFLNWQNSLFSFLINTGWTPQDDGKRLIFHLFLGRDEDALFIEKRRNGCFIAGYKSLGLEGKNKLIDILVKRPSISNLLYSLIAFENSLEIMSSIFKLIIENKLKETLVFFLKKRDEDFIIKILSRVSISNEDLFEIGLIKGGLILCMVYNCLKNKGFRTNEPLILEFMEYVGKIEDEILRINIDALSANNKMEIVSILSKIKDERAIDSLIKLLKDQSWRIKRLAANCLVEIGGSKVLSCLIELFKEKDWALRVICGEVLARLGQEKVIEFLIKAQSDETLAVSEEAYISLAKISSPLSCDVFIKALRHNNIKIRRIAATGLGKIGDNSAIKPLIRVLDDRDDIVRLQASYSLANIGKKYGITLSIEGKGLYIKEGIIRAIGIKKEEQHINFLIFSLNDNDFKIRREAIKSLKKIGKPEFIKPLIKMLADEKLEVKREASIALCRLGEEKGFGILVDGIRSKNWRVQMQIAHTMGNYTTENRERALKLLAELTKDSNPQIRAASIIGIGMMKDEKFTPTLLMAWTQEREPGIKKRIITSLINIGSLKGQRAFILGLSDKSEEIRAASAYGFSKLKIKEGFAILIEKIDDNSPRVRKSIFSSLRRLVDEFGMEIAEKNLVLLDKKIRELGDVQRDASEMTEILLLRLSLAVLKYKKKSEVGSRKSEVSL